MSVTAYAANIDAIRFYQRHGFTAISIGMPASSLTGRLADGCLSTGIVGRTETCQTWAKAEIRAYARRDGGFLVIVTHAAHPAQLTPDGLDQALASPLTLADWVRLGLGIARQP
jgi:hypothetical protein